MRPYIRIIEFKRDGRWGFLQVTNDGDWFTNELRLATRFTDCYVAAAAKRRLLRKHSSKCEAKVVKIKGEKHVERQVSSRIPAKG